MMGKPIAFMAASLALSFLMGCASICGIVVPDMKERDSTSSPVIQNLVTRAASQALSQALKNQTWKPILKQKKVAVEILGVVSPEYASLPGYIRASLETELGKAGAVVPAADAAKDGIEYRVLVNIRQGGIEISKRTDIDGGTLALQAGTMAAGLGLGVSLIGPLKEYAVLPGGSALIAGAVWLALAPPIKDSYKLDATVALEVSFLPQARGGVFLAYAGEGNGNINLPAAGDPMTVYSTSAF